MACFECWLEVDLKKGLELMQIDDTLFYGDTLANMIGVRVLNGGAPSELSGTCTGYVQRVDGSTVVVPGSVSGNAAYFTLPAACYAYTGPVNIAITVTSGSSTTTLVAVRAKVAAVRSDTTVDPGSVIPSLDTLLARISEMEIATAAANLVVANNEDRLSVAVIRSSNLYNSATRALNVQLYANGELHEIATYDTSAYIPVTPSSRYYAGYWVDGDPGAWGTSQQVISICAFYDASMTLITPTIAADVMRTTGAVAPANAAFMRLSINRGTITNASERVMITESALPSVYDGYWMLAPGITAPVAALKTEVAAISASIEHYSFTDDGNGNVAVSLS